MKKILLALLSLLLLIPTQGQAQTNPYRQIPEAIAPLPQPSMDFPSMATHEVGGARADLVVPSEIWSRAIGNVGYAGGPFGFSDQVMSNYRGSTCVLPLVTSLFRDITTIPRFTGRIADTLIATPSDFSNVAGMGFGFLSVSAGRGLVAPTGADWGVTWIDKSTSVDQALEKILDLGTKKGIENAMNPRDRKQWDMLPEDAKRLVVRTLVASIESAPLIEEALNQDFLKAYFKVDDMNKVSRDQFYTFASAPWQDLNKDESSQIIQTPLQSFDYLDKFDLKYMMYASMTFTTMLKGAIDEWQATGNHDFGNFSYCQFKTIAGTVAIYGPGDNKISGNSSMVFDFGGNDTYTGSTAVPRSFSEPISIVIDTAGNDTYDSGSERTALACGLGGIGGIFDLGGNDVYKAKESGIGCAWYGMGIVMDYAGDDEYHGDHWTQAAGHAGVGMLIDLKGNDNYFCNTESQGFGATYGAGILMDVEGNDVYFADPEGNISVVFEMRSVNFAQGTGFGRRADFGDGHSLGGGVGFLVDGAGDDSYTCSVYGEGAGYWWSLGALEDLGGNDTYRSEQYSTGAAPHFAIGSCVDLSGDDKYNVGYDDLTRQVQGCARDGSVGIFIDGSGNDQYLHKNYCAGSSDLNCATLFWDRMGDDTYLCDRDPWQQDSFSYGNATTYEIFRSFRDEVSSGGIFLDTGGNDTYTETWPDAASDIAKRGPELQFGENKEWHHKEGPQFWGYGLDINWYSGIKKEEPKPAS